MEECHKRYLWASVALQYVVFTIAATRGSEVLVRRLGAVFRGVLCSDRFRAYLKYHSGKAQFCWAYLKRNLLGIADVTKSRAVERFCRDALAKACCVTPDFGFLRLSQCPKLLARCTSQAAKSMS